MVHSQSHMILIPSQSPVRAQHPTEHGRFRNALKTTRDAIPQKSKPTEIEHSGCGLRLSLCLFSVTSSNLLPVQLYIINNIWAEGSSRPPPPPPRGRPLCMTTRRPPPRLHLATSCAAPRELDREGGVRHGPLHGHSQKPAHLAHDRGGSSRAHR